MMPGRCSKGFTLLELMLSMTALSLVVVIIAGAMRLGYRAVDSGGKKIETLERLRSSLNIIDAQIRSQMPLSSNDDDSKKYLFKGESGSMRFASNYSIWSGQRGYVMVSYRVAAEASKYSLYATENVINLKAVNEVKLFEGCDDIKFEYFHKEQDEGPGIWADYWKDENGLPEKVKINLTFDKKSFPLIIPMKARGTSGPLFGQIIMDMMR
ncbi:MAG: prepilin-type N-terminal cleavage/methylation domain-containing protein [Nitrospirae bacterium]|nr:MAG: prepilin-type N-terminal cleavage/methylation domain-containing protein [Nitrospirota bacterium]